MRRIKGLKKELNNAKTKNSIFRRRIAIKVLNQHTVGKQTLVLLGMDSTNFNSSMVDQTCNNNRLTILGINKTSKMMDGEFLSKYLKMELQIADQSISMEILIISNHSQTNSITEVISEVIMKLKNENEDTFIIKQLNTEIKLKSIISKMKNHQR